MIGYLYAYTTETGAPQRPDAGVWRLSGARIEGPDYGWRLYNTTTSIRMRTFYYDSTDKWPTFVENAAYPRIEKCDGTQLSLQHLLRGPYPMFFGKKTGLGSALIKVKQWH
jgi:hypothetical protein